jgi:hypothetical protein
MYVRRRVKWVVVAPLILLVFALFVFLGGEIVRLLWNWLLPPLFGFPTITFWQALGLLALCRILFGGFSSGRRIGRKVEDSMKPEDRERFRQRIRERFDLGPPSPTEGPQP